MALALAFTTGAAIAHEKKRRGLRPSLLDSESRRLRTEFMADSAFVVIRGSADAPVWFCGWRGYRTSLPVFVPCVPWARETASDAADIGRSGGLVVWPLRDPAHELSSTPRLLQWQSLFVRVLKGTKHRAYGC